MVPTDLPLADLHPKPELLPTWHAYDMPDLPNFGEFLVPHVARAGDGFAVFSVYRTQRDENPREEESPNEDLIGPAYSLVTTIAGGASYTLLADWDYGEGGSPIETSTPDSFRQPWIVGACHWMQQAGGQERPTAYCLVWEHLYLRRGRGIRIATAAWAAASCSTERTAVHRFGSPSRSLRRRCSPPAWTGVPATRSW